MSQLMAFVASRSRRLVTVWTLFGPMPRLSTDQASVSQGLRVCHRVSLEGGQHLGMPCLFLSLLLLGLGLLLFPVSCCNLILISDAHWDRNLSFKITHPS